MLLQKYFINVAKWFSWGHSNMGKTCMSYLSWINLCKRNANFKKMVICNSGLYFTDSRKKSPLSVNININYFFKLGSKRN